MPFVLLRQDITSIVCDAVVNPTNENLTPGGGIDEQIHRKAGPALADACRKIGALELGKAVLTPAFGLTAGHIIHTAGPVWRGGDHGEEAALRSCYRESLSLAAKENCETVAVPLISSGSYGYPKDRVLRVALDEISRFLLNSDMTVYVTVFDKESFEISEKLFGEVSEFISDKYAENILFAPTAMYKLNASEADKPKLRSKKLRPRGAFPARAVLTEEACDASFGMGAAPSSPPDAAQTINSLDEMIRQMDESFSLKLLRLIDAKKLSEVECYKKANVSKQTWFKIMNDASYHPSKNTVISFAIALELTLEETKSLLATVGYALSRSSKFDIIIEYFISHGNYNMFEIDETLFKFDQVTLCPYN